MSPYDRVALSASFYYFWDERLNCERALEQLVKRTRDRGQAETIVRAKFGCNTVSDKPRVVIDGIGYHSCLCRYKHPLFYPYMELSTQLERGLLPDRGAYMDQPAQMLEALQLLARLKIEAQNAETEKERNKANGRR